METYDVKDRVRAYPRYDETRKCEGKDIEIFYYAESDNRKSSYAAKMEEKARNICGGCPMLKPCQDYAIKYEEYGFWGGLPAAARKLIRNKMGIKIVVSKHNRPARH
jgi:WhiB family redox-sensing transcriptional regulator